VEASLTGNKGGWVVNKKRLIALILLALFASVMVVGCGGGAEKAAADKSGGSAVQNDPNEEYVYLTLVSSVPYWVDSREGIKAAGEYLGVKTTFMGPADFDPAAEAKMLDDLIAKKPAGIIVYPGDDTLTDAIYRAMEAGIPIITDNSDAAKSTRLSHTGYDGYQAGRTGAELMAKALNGKGNVIIGGFPNPNVLDREKGYQDVFKEKYPDIKVVAVINDYADPSKAPEAYAQALAAHPDATGIVGCDGDSGKGAATAVTDAGLKGKVQIVCMDRNDDMLPFIEDGTITASIADKAYMDAFLGVNMLYWWHHGIINPIDGWKDLGINVLPASIDSGVMPITKDNVAMFKHVKK
jgi:ribose transport system substrate-binding protein